MESTPLKEEILLGSSVSTSLAPLTLVARSLWGIFGEWGTLGYKYAFVKVGHIGAQIYICNSEALWGSGAHRGTNIHL